MLLINSAVVNMRFRSVQFRPYVFAACALVGASALVACADNPVLPGGDAPAMGNASPVASSPAVDEAKLAGVTVSRPEFSRVSDMAIAGDTLAVRNGGTLWFGTVDELADGGTVVDIDPSCGDLSATADHFVLACDSTVQLFVADETTAEEITPEVDFPVTSATRMNNGDLVLASNETADVAIVAPDGVVHSKFIAAAPTDELVHVESESHGEQLVRTWREDTTIQNLDWRNERGGGTLRVGLGVGAISAGDEGLILAADTRGNQLAVYTALDVIRLHQTTPVPAGPWAVGWDSDRELAWVASTEGNRLTGFKLSSGVPQQASQLHTIADAQSMVINDEGTIVLGSASGAGIQVIADPELSEENAQ